MPIEAVFTELIDEPFWETNHVGLRNINVRLRLTEYFDANPDRMKKWEHFLQILANSKPLDSDKLMALAQIVFEIEQESKPPVKQPPDPEPPTWFDGEADPLGVLDIDKIMKQGISDAILQSPIYKEIENMMLYGTATPGAVVEAKSGKVVGFDYDKAMLELSKPPSSKVTVNWPKEYGKSIIAYPVMLHTGDLVYINGEGPFKIMADLNNLSYKLVKGG